MTHLRRVKVPVSTFGAGRGSDWKRVKAASSFGGFGRGADRKPGELQQLGELLLVTNQATQHKGGHLASLQRAQRVRMGLELRALEWQP